MTNPVACAVVFHSVSKARVLSICIVTTPVAMRSSVCAQVDGAIAGTGVDTGKGVGAGVVVGAGVDVGAAEAPAIANSQTIQTAAKRVMRILERECAPKS
jgi:hypothetical protein